MGVPLPEIDRKGIGLIFPNPDTEIGVGLTRLVRAADARGGNASEHGDRRQESREEFSFLCKGRTPWNRLARR
jgi:hypothetical protein